MSPPTSSSTLRATRFPPAQLGSVAQRIPRRLPRQAGRAPLRPHGQCPETRDNDFTWADFQARNNNELVAILGNFVNRVMVLTKKYFEGVVPAAGEYTDVDREAFSEMKAPAESLTDNPRASTSARPKDAIGFSRLGNKYLQDCEPWKIFATDPARVATVLNVRPDMRLHSRSHRALHAFQQREPPPCSAWTSSRGTSSAATAR